MNVDEAIVIGTPNIKVELIRIYVTKSFIEVIEKNEYGYSYKEVLQGMSKQDCITLYCDYFNGEYAYYMNSYYGVIVLKNSDKDSFCAVTLLNRDLYRQNNFIKYGTTYEISSLSFKVIDQNFEFYAEFCNGHKQEIDHSNDSYIIRNGRTIAEKLIENKNKNDIIKKNDISKKFERVLLKAKEYINLSYELEEKKVSENKYSYYKVESIEYDKIDRIKYNFILLKNENSSEALDRLKSNVYIQISDLKEKRNTAEITNVTILGENIYVETLFTKEFDIKDIPSSGWFTLSYSTVMRDVQTKAVDKIIDGGKTHDYLNNLYTYNRLKPIININLDGFINELKSRKNPPNNTQIEAIKKGIETKDLFLIMGPPGTGKTTVISSLIEYFVLIEHKRVLISSKNNTAVDNVLCRLDSKFDLLRIGSESKIDFDNQPFMLENKLKEFREKAQVNITDNIKIIKENLLFLNDYIEEVFEFLYLQKSFEIINNDLLTMVKEKLVKRYKFLLDIKRKTDSLRGDYKKNTNTIIYLKKELSEVKKGFLLTKIINDHKRNNLNNKITSIENSMQKQITDYRNLAHEYFIGVKEYKEDYHKIKNTIFVNYIKAKDKQEKSQLYLQNKIEGQVDSFSTLQSITIKKDSLKNLSSSEYYYNSTLECIAKHKSLLKIMEDWQCALDKSQNYALNNIILESVDVAGATCIGVNSQHKFSELEFDVSIIDEAGQIQIQDALVPMSISDKTIMLGDFNQIPPLVENEFEEECRKNGIKTDLLNISYFEHLYTLLLSNDELNKHCIMLDRQYRMPKEIADILSKWFYDNNYNSSEEKTNCGSPIKSLSNHNLLLVDTSGKKKRFEVKSNNGGYYNPLEATLALDILKLLIRYDSEYLKDIGIISPYKKQVTYINELSSRLNINKDVANTLDSFQGKEKEIIIYSFTRSSTKKSIQKRIGFLNELRRLNVAMSRCKKMLILIGDFDYLSTCENVDYDDDDEPLLLHSEKEFSNFIKFVLKEVQNGSGEYIDYDSFIKRVVKINE